MKLGDVFSDTEVARLYHYRAAYPNGIFEILRKLIVAPRVVLDAGAGSGALARRMIEFADRVDAVDPSAAMIDAGKALPGGDKPRIRWILGRAEDALLSPPYGLITCGASLHWMDLDVVLPRFREALAPGAVVAVVDTDYEHGPYSGDVRNVITQFSELEHHQGTSELIGELRSSGRFVIDGETRLPPARVEQSVDDYLAALHSTSTLARVRLGDRSASFDEKIRAVFARHVLDRVAFDVVGYVAWGRPA